MAISRTEVITSVQRRRRWSREDKERLVAASLESGASVSEVARAAGLYQRSRHPQARTTLALALGRRDGAS